MNVVSVPGSLDQQTIDGFFDEVVDLEGSRTLFDARHLRWIDPNGMVGLLVAGTVAAKRQGERPRLEPPESADVHGYLARMGFFEEAKQVIALAVDDQNGAFAQERR